MIMEENYRWIKVNFYGNGEEISVRQSETDRSVFFDADGHTYTIDELDFTQIPEQPRFIEEMNERMRKSDEEHERTQSQLRDMLASIDARAIADHQAVIDERAYWRKLRGDIALEIIRKRADKNSYGDIDNYKWVCNAANMMCEKLHNQDKEFFMDKMVSNLPIK